MHYANLLAETWNRHILFSAMLELTYRCNLHCFYCYNDVDSIGKPMAMADYLTLLEDLKALGAMNLSLTGGEPTVSPHFFDLGRAAKSAGFVVRVKSNGHALRHDLAMRLKQEIDPFIVEISLHGATAPAHDRQTRVSGSFKRLLANLDTLRKLGIRVQLNSTLTLWNEHEMEDMFALADQLGLRLEMEPQVTPRDNGDKEPLQIAPTSEGIAKLLLLKKQRFADERDKNGQTEMPPPDSETKHHCGAGAASVTVDPWGNVYPCVQWRKPIGNLHEQCIEEIWMYSPRLQEVRRITQEAKDMVAKQGDDAQAAGFCPALAEQLEGSPLRFDREAQNRLSIHRNLFRKENAIT
jgi:MoaA/NifB/PqqE/SkfB family radical SAM enzyme